MWRKEFAGKFIFSKSPPHFFVNLALDAERAGLKRVHFSCIQPQTAYLVEAGAVLSVHEYAIVFDANGAWQVNVVTGRKRPLRRANMPHTIDSLPAVSDETRRKIECLNAKIDDDDVPKQYKCPISMSLMKEPVLARDGHSYDREPLTQWLSKKQSSPVTGLPLHDLTLVPNLSLRSMISEFVQEHARLVADATPCSVSKRRSATEKKQPPPNKKARRGKTVRADAVVFP